MSRFEAVICDFGGVLTSPLAHAFLAFQAESGVPVESLGRAMARVAAEDGANPLFELETGRLSEADFLDRLGQAITAELGRPISLDGFAERYFAALHPNHELFEHLRGLRDSGLRLAMLTNNVREWEPRWRTMLPIDEIFEVVVDSGFVGTRKPEHEIYEITLERLGLPAEACVFIDDFEVNCDAATELGITAIRYESTEQTIAALDALLAGGSSEAE